MGFGSPWHWLIVLLIVVLVFGTKKLRNIGQDLGGAVKGFKEGMREAELDNSSKEEQSAEQITAKAAQDKPATTIDVQAKDSETK